MCLFYFQEEQANRLDGVKSDAKYDTDQLGGALMGRVCGKRRACRMFQLNPHSYVTQASHSAREGGRKGGRD